MSIASRLAAASLATLAFSGSALAQDFTEPAAGEPAADGATVEAGATAEVTPVAMDGTVAPSGTLFGTWSRSVNNRPLTLLKGLGAVNVDIINTFDNFFDPAVIRLAFGYGITDDLELGFVGYTFPTDDLGVGSIDANVGYQFVKGGAGGKLDIAARGQIGFSLAEDVNGDAYGVTPLGLGVHLRFRVNEKISIVSGQPNGSIDPLGLGTIIPALGGLSPQLQIGLQDPSIVALNLPVGVGFQATPELYLQVDTNLANIVISDGDTGAESGFIFADSTPLTLTGVYNAMPNLDVYAALSLNVTPPDPIELGDTLALGVGARFYFGNLGAGAM